MLTGWVIRPRDGMGPLRFGMTMQEVAAALGGIAPARTDPSWDGRSVSEFRTLALPTCGYGAGVLNFIGTGPQTPRVRFGDLDIFASPPLLVLQTLERHNKGASIGLGSVVFGQLRISTTNFFDEDTHAIIEPPPDQDDRTLSLTRDDDQDGVAQFLKPISFL